MYPTNTLREKASLFFHILWPILITQISYNLMTVIDTMMSGRAGTDDLAGVAVGSSLWMPVYTGLTGIMLAITPIVGQLIGNNKRSDVGHTVTQGFYLAILISLLVLAVGFFALQPVLGIMDLSTDVHTVATDYLHGLAIGIIPLFASAVLRNFFDAQGYTRVTMIILLLALPVNTLLNYLLIFGNFGFPELGGAGAGYATAITYWFIFGVSIFLTFQVKEMRSHYLFVRWYKVSFQSWKEQLKIGVPMGLSTFFEASIFSVVTLLMGSLFDTNIIAAHQTALNFTTLMFMVPLSISIGMTIVVSYEVGARRMEHAKQYAILGVSSAIVVIGILSLFLFLFREQISYLYTSDRAVVLLAMQFMLFAIMYQFSDAAQASLQGVLRGYKDVTVPFIIAFISYWIVGLPSGYLLARYTTLEPYGFWVGITLGLTCAAVGFFLRLRFIQRREKQAAL
jgi:multidrug resistance protein, MATE family